MRLTSGGTLRINYRNVQDPASRLVCNFKCSYCVTETPQRRPYDASALRQTRRIWDALETLDDTLIVRVNFDGETLIDRWAIECVLDIAGRSNVARCEVITNNSIPPRRYLGRMDTRKMSFACSFHPEYITLNRFLGNLAALRDAGCPAFVYTVATPGALNGLVPLVERFRSEGYDIRIEGLMEPYQGREYPQAYTADERSLLHEVFYSPEEFAYGIDAANPRGKPCYAGTDEITVTMDGRVARCYECEMGDVGELMDGTWTLPPDPQPCPEASCLCPAYHIYLAEFRERYTMLDAYADHYRI